MCQGKIGFGSGSVRKTDALAAEQAAEKLAYWSAAIRSG
jgi:hypothetical protein